MAHLVPIDEVVYFDVLTHNPSTGAVSDADSTPTFDVYEEATDTGLLGATNFTKRTSLTGDYRGTFTASAANGFEAGKWYSVIASATVNSIAAKTCAMHFRCAPAESVAGVPKVDPSTWDGTDITTGVPLAPTVAGRTLDVSAGGEAGVDWANVGSPTTTVGLSGTTVKTATDVETDTQDIQARLPAALTANGNMKSSLVEILTTALTETAGLLAGGFKKFFNVSTPTGTLNSLPDAVPGAAGGLLIDDVWTDARAAKLDYLTGDAYARLGAPAGASVSADVAAVKSDTGAIKTKTDNLPATPAATGDAMTLTTGERTAIADETLTRDWTMIGSPAARSLLNAARFLRNKWTLTGATLSVKEEDDSTEAWSSTVSTDAAADPITGSDPA